MAKFEDLEIPHKKFLAEVIQSLRIATHVIVRLSGNELEKVQEEICSNGVNYVEQFTIQELEHFISKVDEEISSKKQEKSKIE
ncbi:hypothetical protein ACL6C3_16785 [Capilliphycus salinus ALCB114379]|uniref:hypothetical protein n=1 Tax=Capilliphycus salinus TaxID=2768948 RepID=UPI0039A5C1B6